MNRVKLLLFLALLIFVSVKFTDIGRGYVVSLNNYVLEKYLYTKEYINSSISEHFAQQETIKRQKKEIKELEKSALLSIAFAGKLNDILKDNNLSTYKPDVKMIRAISYSNLNNYNRVWLDFKDFNKSKIYGLLYQGYATGIVVEKNSHPLGLLLGDTSSIFSVYVGKDKIPGVLQGDKKDVLVKYIPLWMNPKIGDDVVTSGMDDIFFQGVRVGKVIGIRKEESSKTVIVQPYVNLKVPTYLHVITKN
jgi:rod shape-determining protein MreC